jgi:hypothetical protein
MLRNKMERLITAYQDGLLSLEQLRERMPNLKQQSQAVNSELQLLDMRPTRLDQQLSFRPFGFNQNSVDRFVPLLAAGHGVAFVGIGAAGDEILAADQEKAERIDCQIDERHVCKR